MDLLDVCIYDATTAHVVTLKLPVKRSVSYAYSFLAKDPDWRPETTEDGFFFKLDSTLDIADKALSEKVSALLSGQRHDESRRANITDEKRKLISFLLKRPAEIDEEDWDENKIHVIYATAEFLEALDTVGNWDAILERSAKKGKFTQQLLLARRMKQSTAYDSPSTSIQNAKNIEKNLGNTILVGRPATNYGLSPSVYSPILAELESSLNGSLHVEPDPVDYNNAVELVSCLIDFYDNEHQRSADLEPILRAIFDGYDMEFRQPLPFSGAIPDLVAGKRSVFAEWKNEQGLGGNPWLHVIFSFNSALKADQYNSTKYCFPTVLLSLAGDAIDIGGAVYTDAVIAEKYKRTEFRAGHDLERATETLARDLASIRKCLAKIDEEHIHIPDHASMTVACSPRPTLRYSSSPAIPAINYQGRVSGGVKQTMLDPHHDVAVMSSNMFVGNIESQTQEVIIKFATRYQADAHRLLASSDPPLAPKLHYCEEVVGGYHMVVMDRLPYQTVRAFSLATSSPNSPPPGLLSRIKGALVKLHENGFVFGDLRASNVLFDEVEGRIFLIDFDWAGKEGTVKYPATLTISNRDYARAGLRRGDKITTDKDLKLLGVLGDHWGKK